MNISKFFNIRFFVIASVLVSGFVLNVIMMAGEEVALPRTVKSTQRQVSRLKKLRYTQSDRKKNVEAIGAPSRVTKEVLRDVSRYEKLYRKSNPHPIVSGGLQDGPGRQPAAWKFCRQMPRQPDPAYLAFPVLVEMNESGQLNVLPVTDLTKPIVIRNVMIEPEIKQTYETMEESDFGGRPDKPCVAISLMLLGKDSEIRERSYDDNPADPLMPPTCEVLLTKYNGLEEKLIRYLANFHYVAELAQDPDHGICDK